MTDITNSGAGVGQSPNVPQVAQAAAMLKARQVSQGAYGNQSASYQSPQYQGNSGSDMDSLRQQMQATRAMNDNYQQRLMQTAASGSNGDPYGQAASQQFMAQVAAFRQKVQAYARMGQLSPAAQARAFQVQQLRDNGMDDNADALQSLWAMQDQAGQAGQAGQQ